MREPLGPRPEHAVDDNPAPVPAPARLVWSRLGRRRLLALAAACAVPALLGTATAAAVAVPAPVSAVEDAELAPTAQADAAGAQAAAAIPGIFAEAAAGKPTEPQPQGDMVPTADAAVLMDASSGQTLWAKNANARRPVASVTKLMTMAVVIDALGSGRIKWNDLVSASEAAVRTGGAQIWLELGENMTVKDLYYAVAVQSANDAAVALAEFVGGTSERFIQMMNAKAQALGMRDTLYTDPNGLDDSTQYSSAYDVALLSRYLVTQHPEVLRFTATWEYRLRSGKLWMVNRNKLLTRLPGADGLKTGFTTRSGYCLAATAKRGPTRLISVVLGDTTGPQRFDDSASLLQWGFSNYTTVAVADPGTVTADVPVDGGRLHSVAIVPKMSFGVTVPRGREKSVSSRSNYPSPLSAPLRAGQQVGEIQVAVDGKPVASIPLVARVAVPRIGPLHLWLRLWSTMWPWLKP